MVNNNNNIIVTFLIVLIVSVISIFIIIRSIIIVILIITEKSAFEFVTIQQHAMQKSSHSHWLHSNCKYTGKLTKYMKVFKDCFKKNHTHSFFRKICEGFSKNSTDSSLLKPFRLVFKKPKRVAQGDTC